MGQREYPSIRKALLGQSENGVANLWCGVKWLTWQATYLAIGLLIAAFGAVILPVYLVAKFFQGGRAEIAYNWLARKLYNFATHDYTSKAVRWGLTSVAIGTVVGLAGLLVYGLVYYPERTLMEVGVITLVLLGIGALAVVVRILEVVGHGLAARFSDVKSKSEEKPVARRVIGYCPVSMDITPKWFEKIFEP